MEQYKLNQLEETKKDNMPRLSNPIVKTLTVAGSTISFTFQNLKNMSLEHLFVKPTNAGTQYDITITDASGFEVFKEEEYKGSRSITNKRDLPNIITGSFTLKIDADNDEDFNVALYISENL